MWRVGFSVKNSKETYGKNFETKAECENWLLEQADKHEIKTSIIYEKGKFSTRIIERW